MKDVLVARLDEKAADAPVARALATLCAMLPRVGVADRGRFVCDLHGLAGVLGEPRRIGRRVLAACGTAGARCAVGIAATPFVARVVAEHAALGTVAEAPGDERAYLAHLPLTTLPLVADVRDELVLLGLRTVGAFAALEPGAVLDRFGRAAAAAHALARADDRTPIHGTAPRRSIGARRRWDDPLREKEQLLFALRVAIEGLAALLAADGLAAMRLAVKLERERGAPVTFSRVLLPPAADPAAMLRSLRWALDERERSELGGIVGAALEVVEIEPLRGRQIGLFAPDGVRREEALAVAQHIRARLGPGAVLRARVVDAAARLPDREAEWSEAVS